MQSFLYKFLLLLFVLCTSHAFASTNPEHNEDTIAKNKRHYLKLQGVVREPGKTATDKGKPLANAIIKVFDDKHKLLGSFTTNNKGKCEFRVPINKQFFIEFTKEGYVSKIIQVNTNMPPERKLAFIFPFEVTIFKEVNGLDVSILKKPVAKVVYNIIEHQFDYDYTFTNRINSELKVLYEEYERLKAKEASTDTLKNK